MTVPPTHQHEPLPGASPESGPVLSDGTAQMAAGAPAETHGEAGFPPAPADLDTSGSDTSRTAPPIGGPDHGPRWWPRVAGALILLAGAGGVWVWLNPESLPMSVRAQMRGVFGNGGPDPTEVALKTLDARTARLEQRPPADLGPLTGRLDALEKRVAAPPPRPVDIGPLLARLDALETRIATISSAIPPREGTAEAPSLPPSASAPSGAPAYAAPIPPPVDLAPIVTRLTALEHRAAEPTADPGKVEALSNQLEALSARDPAPELRTRLDSAEKQLTGLAAATTAKVAEVSDQAARLARSQAVAAALAAGQKLGPMPGAPPALARFATIAPPTVASLRLAFPAAEQAALKVSLPDTAGKSFVERILARLQDFHLITVRQGEEVLVGNATAATLSHARALLDAGDVDGAARAVSSLTGAPAEAMAPWLSDARALLAAREAMASLAGHG